ncbi:hypothetical protein EON78_03740 [bacterium]|nr:MAG: hypothetical protein EON78_03740 [bacterium]
MAQNNPPSPENEYILAAVSYLPIIGLFLVFTSGKRYFVRYHAGHSVIIYLFSFALLFTYIALYMFLRNIITDTFILDTAWGLVFSIHLLVNFIYLLYCAVQAYLGSYLIIPVITKVFYLIFNR